MVLVLVLGIAGVAKLFAAGDASGKTLQQRVSQRVGVPAAWIGVAEIALAASLVSTWRLRFFAGLTSLVWVAFTLILIWELSRRNPSPCGCFGEFWPASSRSEVRIELLVSIIRNLGLTVASLFLMFHSSQPGAGVEAQS
jgi:hypothetical protein